MTSYVNDNPFVEAALILLDETAPKVASAILRTPDPDLHPFEVVAIDWERLDRTMLSSTERTRLDMARSLLDGTPVSLAGVAAFGGATWDRMMSAFEQGRGRR